MRSLVRRLRIIIGAAVATAAAATSSMVHLAEATATAATGGDYIRKGDLPNTGRDWVSLHQTVEFLPASATKSVPYFPPIAQQQQLSDVTGGPLSSSSSTGFQRPQRALENNAAADDGGEDTTTDEDNSQYRVQPFVEGVSDYSGYQQAWRLLGFMIDCDSTSNNNNKNNNKRGRLLGESHDENGTGEGCQRYVVWAAYVDLDYEGGGIGEYQFWDKDTNKWDTSACEYSAKFKSGNNKNNNNNNNNKNGDSPRCAKMDCHLKDTHWSLLGFFKHKSYDDWMEQLFKHEGICVWTDDEYSFMKSARKTWPGGCTVSGTVTGSGDPIYYDVMPVRGGGITIGLYTDTRCVKVYQSQGKDDPITVENVVGNMLANGGSGDHGGDKNKNNNNNNNADGTTFEESLAVWDSSFDIFKICQPCVAYDRFNYGYSANDDSYRGSNYGTYRYGYDVDDWVWYYYYSKKYGGSDFDCYDDAGYTNVNQCMKFMAKTEMNTATFRDISLATTQGSLVDSPLAGYQASSSYYSPIGYYGTYVFLAASFSVLIYGVIKFRKARREMQGSSNWSPKEPLIFA